VVIISSFIMNRTRLGRHIYAVGGNPMAARFSGIKNGHVQFFAYIFSGTMAGISGVVLAARMFSGQPTAGQSFEMDAIAACFIGGASTTGGIGRIGGAMIGGLIMAVISNGMQLMGISQGVQPVVKGLILLLAVAFDLVNKKRAASVA
jgi:ABC-type xylose transport system permease subunit